MVGSTYLSKLAFSPDQAEKKKKKHKTPKDRENWRGDSSNTILEVGQQMDM